MTSRNNPLKSPYFEKKYNICKGDFQRAISYLRSKAIGPCADGSGYYMPETPEEIEAFVNQMFGRIKAMMPAIKGMTLQAELMRRGRDPDHYIPKFHGRKKIKGINNRDLFDGNRQL